MESAHAVIIYLQEPNAEVKLLHSTCGCLLYVSFLFYVLLRLLNLKCLHLLHGYSTFNSTNKVLIL